MARFVLQPCKVREDRFVDLREQEPLDLNWRELLEKFAPAGGREEGIKLRALQADGYVGLIRSSRSEKVINFLLINPDRSGNLGWILKRDPSFDSRVLEAYRVVEVTWDSLVTESQG